MKEKKDRVDDALHATRAAVEEGIVPGGGTMFVHLAEMLKNWAKLELCEDELTGALIVRNSLFSPLYKWCDYKRYH